MFWGHFLQWQYHIPTQTISWICSDFSSKKIPFADVPEQIHCHSKQDRQLLTLAINLPSWVIRCHQMSLLNFKHCHLFATMIITGNHNSLPGLSEWYFGHSMGGQRVFRGSHFDCHTTFVTLPFRVICCPWRHLVIIVVIESTIK